MHRTHRAHRTGRIAAAVAATALALTLAAAGSSAAPHGGPPRGPHPGPGDLIERHADELGLDEETRTAIRAAAEAARERHQAMRPQLEAAHDAMRDLLMQDAPDEAAVMQQAERINALELALQQDRLRTLLDIRALLTPEQRARLVELREQRREARFGRMGPKGEGPPRRWLHRRGGPHRGVCREDVVSACPGAADGRAVARCLSEQWDALSPPCRDRLDRLSAPPTPPDDDL